MLPYYIVSGITMFATYHNVSRNHNVCVNLVQLVELDASVGHDSQLDASSSPGYQPAGTGKASATTTIMTL